MAAPAKTILITGASRGIGAALANHWLGRGHAVIAAARNPDGARDLWELERDYGDRLTTVGLDVESNASVAAAAKALEGRTIDVLVNNAGVLPASEAPFARLSEGDVVKAMSVNAIGPIRVTQAFLPHLERAEAPIVVVISSLMGSLADNRSGRAYAYRMSKAAANMFVRSFAVDHPKIVAVTMHPGWVATDMGGPRAPVRAVDAAAGLAGIIDGLTLEQSGKFLAYDDRELPW
jgi:NAD(P)-dependent dehydrogenase (short-subunit alcohol dehydrogenase family)